ncbi:MAG: hypothetical protein WEB53_15660 [Akkermansiaceae bacterium]
MPAAPSEPEKYSIDEMMDRLKNTSPSNPEGNGELVVRADGTQAMRVRKRKRRSEQPKKEMLKRTRRARVLQVSAAMSLLVVAGLGFGAAVIYANSPPFRDGLVTKISETTGAQVELTTFRMNPTTANAGGLSLRWPEGNVLSSLTLRGMIAEVFPSSFLGKSMTGEEVTVSEGTLVLQIPKPDQRLRIGVAPTGEIPLLFNRYRIPKFHTVMGTTTAPPIRLSNSEGSLFKNPLSGRTQFTLNGGDLTLQGWPKLRVDRAFLEFRGKEIDVVSLQVMDESDDNGVLEFSGTVQPYSPDDPSTLAVEVKAFPLTGLTGPALGRLFSGKVDSIPASPSSYFSFHPSENPAAKLSVDFRSALTSSIEVSGFPFLLSLSQLLADDWFQTPVFNGENAEAVFQRNAGVVTLENLKFESKSRMALRGRITMAANQTLSGELEVGVAEAMITTASEGSRLKALFGPPKEGFCWLTLDISGPVATPVDNFNELFQAAGARRSEEAESTRSTFEDLTKPR